MMLFIGIILYVAAVVQGLIGFAMAIVAIPLLVWIGLPLSEGMGGPPLVLWVAAHQWNGEKIKAFLFANFAILSPVSLLMIRMALGPNILRAAGKGFLFAPLVILGSLLGVLLGIFVPRERLRMTLYIMLLVMDIASIVMA